MMLLCCSLSLRSQVGTHETTLRLSSRCFSGDNSRGGRKQNTPPDFRLKFINYNFDQYNNTNIRDTTVICWTSPGLRVLRCLKWFSPGRREDPGGSAALPGPRTCCGAARCSASGGSWGPARSSREEFGRQVREPQSRPSSVPGLQLRPPSPDSRVPGASLPGLPGLEWTAR